MAEDSASRFKHILLFLNGMTFCAVLRRRASSRICVRSLGGKGGCRCECQHLNSKLPGLARTFVLRVWCLTIHCAAQSLLLLSLAPPLLVAIGMIVLMFHRTWFLVASHNTLCCLKTLAAESRTPLLVALAKTRTASATPPLKYGGGLRIPF